MFLLVFKIFFRIRNIRGNVQEGPDMESGVHAVCYLRTDHYGMFSLEQATETRNFFLFLFLKMSSLYWWSLKQIELQENQTWGDLEWKTERKGSLGEQTEGNSFGSWWRFLEHSQISAMQTPIVGFCPRSESLAMARLPQRSRFEVARGLESFCLSFSSEGGRCTWHCVQIESTHSYCDCVCPCGMGWLDRLWQSVCRQWKEPEQVHVSYEVTKEHKNLVVPIAYAGVCFSSILYFLVV